MTVLRTATATNMGLDKVSVYQRVMDYVILTKPRMVVMILAVTVAGFYIGTTGTPDWVGLLNLLLGVSLASGGTLTLNQYFERHEDALMERTQSRPLPDGRVRPLSALCFGIVITVIGLLYLTFVVHALAGLVTAVTTFTYLFWYTPLKLKSFLCSFVGAIPGALPPVTGWVAARGQFDAEVLVLFGILFLWQIPHALAIGWLYREDFARAGFRLLPVLYPDGKSTGQQIVIHSIALLGVGLIPTIIGLAGPIYLVTALILGLAFLGFAVDVARTRTTESARRLMFASLVYLPLVYLLMALDKSPGILG